MIRDYASTLVAAVVGEKAAVFYQIGDGGSVHSVSGEAESYYFGIEPAESEYVNTTDFITDETTVEHLRFNFIEEPVEDLILISDGVFAVAVNYQTNRPHEPFLRPMIAPLRNGGGNGLNEKLANFLSSAKIKLLQEEVFHYKLNYYLSSFKIADAKNLNLARKDRISLIGGGIRTAADAQSKRLNSLFPINNPFKAKVLEWRKNLERSFEYPPNAKLPEAARISFALEFSDKREIIEREIEQLLVALRSASTFLGQRQQQLTAKIEPLTHEILQTESDLAAVDTSLPTIVTMILITFLLPVFGIMVAGTGLLQSYEIGNKSIPKSSLYSPNVSHSSANSTNTAANASSNGSGFPDNLTDEEIKNMSDSERRKEADVLYEQAVNLGNLSNDYVKAEKKLRVALKLTANDPKILNKLGDALYEQKKYSQSVQIFKQSLQFDSENEETKIYLGINYLKMKKFVEGIQILSEVIGKNPQSFEGNFNLGQIYIEMKKYETAADYFDKALKIKPDDLDAHYKYGFCLYKTGYQELARAEYNIILKKNPGLAEKLGEIIGIDPPKVTTN